MASALKCDRCGSYFDYEPNVKNFIAFGHKYIIVGEKRPAKDICPNCMDLFMKWFENPDSYDPHDLVMNLNDTDYADRTNGSTEKELELETKLNEAKIYIAHLKSELGYTMTKEEMDCLEARGFKETSLL